MQNLRSQNVQQNVKCHKVESKYENTSPMSDYVLCQTSYVFKQL